MRSTDNSSLALVAITALLALIVVAFVAYRSIKYGDGWMPLELTWLLIPIFISIAIFVWASVALLRVVKNL